MMRFIILLFIGIWLSGCVTTEQAKPASNEIRTVKPKLESFKSFSFVDLTLVQNGMTSEDVKILLGDQVKVGYKEIDFDKGTYTEIFLSNPYREEKLASNNKSYEVDFYITKIIKADGIVADDELTPLVFEKNKLVGKGWDFLFELRK